ncbi:DUF3168 domain-containing protein [Pseudonocardia sp. RS010]|uniref:DUF3168 domain-containing protein n=1 Tax=Pseudonocardia sp. RS010 TaxID=3385979 RepID=UPI00399F5A76
MATAAWPVQRALYAALVALPGLAGEPGPGVVAIYDEPPEDAPKPYVVLGELDEQADDAHDRQGIDAGITLHVWSAYRGFREIAGIFVQLDTALDRKPIEIPGLVDVSIAAVSKTLQRDPDPDLRHGVARYRIWATTTDSIT